MVDSAPEPRTFYVPFDYRMEYVPVRTMRLYSRDQIRDLIPIRYHDVVIRDIIKDNTKQRYRFIARQQAMGVLFTYARTSSYKPGQHDSAVYRADVLHNLSSDLNGSTLTDLVGKELWAWTHEN